MTETTAKKLKELYKTLATLRTYSHALGILNFDFETASPVNGKEQEADAISYFSNQAFKIKNSKKVKDLVVYLEEHRAELDPRDGRLIEKLYGSYKKEKNVSPATQLKWSKIEAKAYIDWEKAKRASDFKLFRRSLEKMTEMQKEAVALRVDPLPDVYDELLSDYEKGFTTKELDVFFEELKIGLIDILGKIRSSGRVIRRDFLSRKVPVYKQEIFSRYLLELNGYDLTRGYLTTTEHPFTSSIAENDARVTTHYYEDMFVSNVYSVIHEGGHAIFMQNEPKEDHEHFLNDYITNGMHESVSRFYENVIGRSEEYVRLIYPEFHRLFADELGDVTERELYEAVNIVEPSLIRTEADEVTYGLHIVVRYEVEKAILRGEIDIKDVPKLWNALYEKYLGVTPTSDAVGVLQDVHWSGGYGYFPSYAIGNAYNAMYLKEIKKDMDFYKTIERGDLAAIREWLSSRVFKNANMLDPKPWLFELTGKTLSAKDFLEYLNEKYSKIYGFQN